MAVHDLRKASKIASGQKIVSMGADNSDLEKRVSSIENKLDTLITLLNKEDNNDKDRPKPISGNDSGV
jgi:predicted ATP-grasp superfamily ATP-dependent carboligase